MNSIDVLSGLETVKICVAYETADGKSKYSLSLPMIDLPIPEDALPHFVCPGYDNPKIQLKQEFLHLNGTYRRPAFTNKLIWEKSV